MAIFKRKQVEFECSTCLTLYSSPGLVDQCKMRHLNDQIHAIEHDDECSICARQIKDNDMRDLSIVRFRQQMCRGCFTEHQNREKVTMNEYGEEIRRLAPKAVSKRDHRKARDDLVELLKDLEP